VPEPGEPPGDDDLTAYLDGELEGAAARAVEAQLANDAAARRRAEGLKKAFDLLDYLPKAEPSADFATRTVTSLQPAPAARPTPAETPAVTRAESPRRRALALAGWAVAAGVALGVGAAARLLSPPAAGRAEVGPEDQANDYRLLGRLSLYVGVEDLDFVKALDATDLFEPEMAAEGPPAPPDADAGAAPSDKLNELFRGYPAARRQQLRKLDQDWHDLPAAEQARLRPVLENYAVWLDRLPDGERREVLASPAAARPGAVAQLVQKRWREGLPKSARDKLAGTVGADERLELVREWKAGERARRDEWHAARRQWPTLFGQDRQAPWPFSEPGMAARIDEYVRAVLKVDLATPLAPRADLPAAARLTRAEFVNLRAAHESATKDRNWFVYGVAVYRLAQQHPYLPEPQPGKPTVVGAATLPADLPPRVLRTLPKGVEGAARGKWPEFALEVARRCVAERVAVPEAFGPCRPADFCEPVREFATAVLLPRLTDAERDALKKLEGKWPDYPLKLVALARLPKYDLAVPTVTLPGAPSLWAKFYGSTPPKE